MKNYTIAYTATDDDLKQMLVLDGEAFQGKDAGEFRRCKTWLSVNPDIYTILKLDGKVIGYINFVPLKEEVYEVFYQGHYKDFELTEKDLLPFEKGKDHKCLFMSIVIDRKYRDGESVILLSNAFKDRLQAWQEEGINIKLILADCVSIDGIKYIQNNFGSKFVCNSHNGKIYERNMYEKRVIFPTKLRYEEIDEHNIEMAAKVQSSIFKQEDSLAYFDYLKCLNQTNRLQNKLIPLDYLVYFEDAPIGIVGLCEVEGDNEDIWVDWLGVLPEFRNQGFGTQMLFHIFEIARTYDKENFRLFTFEKFNALGISIYKKTMQVMERYKNEQDNNQWILDAKCCVFSSSLKDKRARKWNNKFINVNLDKINSAKSYMLMKEKGWIE